MNQEALKIAGVTQEDYLKWCKTTNRPPYRSSSKAEFFSRIKAGKLVKDSSGKLVKRYTVKE